jgi:type IV pilus assembly protein PilA
MRWLTIIIACITGTSCVNVCPRVSTVLASEEGAVIQMLNVYKMQRQYLSQFGRYASTLAELGPPANGIVGPQGADLIDSRLASGEKNDYLFTLSNTSYGFKLDASPKVRNGRRSFYLDQTGVIRQSLGSEQATANDAQLVHADATTDRDAVSH